MEIKELYHIYKACGSISTDTRKLSPGSVFFALKGSNYNGNLFAEDALAKGCKYAIVDDPSLPAREHLLHVPDVLEALQLLANYHRKQLTIPVIGITGSNGKTTTKELITSVLRRKFKVSATQGNLNNHIGVPLTLLGISDHDIAVIEMGANHQGEIAALCEISDPGFGIITNIGRAHLEGFGSPEGVIRGKSELYDYLVKRKAKAFIDAGNPLLYKLSKEKKPDAVYYGKSPESICTGIITDNSRFLKASILFAEHQERIEVQTALVGDYNLNNLLAAACIGNYFKVEPSEIALALSEYTPSNSRSQLLVSEKNKIVLDAYNANPSSMESSIHNFISLEDELPKMVILGDMLELGKYSQQEHQSVLDILLTYNFKNIILVGQEFSKVAKNKTFNSFMNVEQLIEHFRINPVKDHSILLKGSRGIKLEKLLEVL